METSPDQILPDLLPEDYEWLKASIAENGVQVPTVARTSGRTCVGVSQRRCG